MTTPPGTEAATLTRLRELCAQHWTFFTVTDSTGEIDELRGVKVWPSAHADALRVRAERDAAAVRCHPDGALLWQREGTLADVLTALLDLPAPTTAAALAIGAGPRLWTPEW